MVLARAKLLTWLWIKIITLPDHCHENSKSNENRLVWNETHSLYQNHLVHIHCQVCWLLGYLTKYGLSCSLLFGTMSGEHGKQGILFHRFLERRQKKKKKKTKGILYNLNIFFNSSNDASKQWDGFFCDFYFLATNGIFLWGRKFIKPLLFIPLTSALPQLWLGWQMYIYALRVVRLKGKVTHSVWNPQEKNPFRVREVLNQQPNFGQLLDWLMG